MKIVKMLAYRIVGLFLVWGGSVGLGMALSEILVPADNPVPKLGRRIVNVWPRLMLALAVPGGYILLTGKLEKKKEPVT